MINLFNSQRCNITDTIENSRIEFKVKLVDNFEKQLLDF